MTAGSVITATMRISAAHRGHVTSGGWGSLTSFEARAWPGTRKWNGTSGNCVVAVLEFGDSVRARAVSAGGAQSPGGKCGHGSGPRPAGGPRLFD